MTVILTYHHVGEVTPKSEDANLFVSRPAFEAQLNQLRRRWIATTSLDDMRNSLASAATGPMGNQPATAGTQSSARAVITFDDGYEDNYLHALPPLQKCGMTATFFITTGRIGQTDERGHRYMTAEQIREMDRAGMTIGSHTVTHPWLGRIPLADARRELADSKKTLEEILGKPVRWLCYPSGSFNREIARAAEEIGYAGACSVIRDNRVRIEQLFWLPRVMVMRDTSPLRFRYYFSSLYHFLHERKNRKRWKEYL
ncbi:polysaccharide deacetylase family protein [Candidatus Sumerlaeota bacterium]|nr:polysaccharide deacetylase family protein [Candidatus Sumerlaeota bacterium]